MRYTALDRQRHRAGMYRHPYSITLEKQADQTRAAEREAELERALQERLAREAAER